MRPDSAQSDERSGPRDVGLSADDINPLDANGDTDVFASLLPFIAAPAVPALSPFGLALLIVVLLAAGWRLVR